MTILHLNLTFTLLQRPTDVFSGGGLEPSVYTRTGRLFETAWMVGPGEQRAACAGIQEHI